MALTTDQFIQKARLVHGDEYDYTLAVYQRSSTKVQILHRACGLTFEQTPSNHISNQQGCPHCFGKKKKTTDQFIAEARVVHGDEYDYSKVVYKNIDSPVELSHKICGTRFWKTPWRHLNGEKCPTCSDSKKTTDQFIAEARVVHGDEYDYSKVVYKNNYSKVVIVHRVCGSEFEQIPFNHLHGRRCYNCYASGIPHSSESFAERAREIHGLEYDYSKSAYEGYSKQLEIYHPRCGRTFLQAPETHLRGAGCVCRRASRGEEAIEQFLLEKGIAFKRQVSPKGLRNPDTNRPLRFDFQVGSLLVEFDGAQHTYPVRFGGCSAEKAEENFAQVRHRDAIKNDFCKSHGLKLLRISSLDNIPQILSEALNA